MADRSGASAALVIAAGSPMAIPGPNRIYHIDRANECIGREAADAGAIFAVCPLRIGFFRK